MRVFKTRVFSRFAREEAIGDAVLCDAIAQAERGLVHANLGGGVIKQRVARAGQGRSSGYRTLIAYRSRTRAVFLYGFAKSDQDNIRGDELRELRRSAQAMLEWDQSKVTAMLGTGAWTEIDCDD